MNFYNRSPFGNLYREFKERCYMQYLSYKKTPNYYRGKDFGEYIIYNNHFAFYSVSSSKY